MQKILSQWNVEAYLGKSKDVTDGTYFTRIQVWGMDPQDVEARIAHETKKYVQIISCKPVEHREYTKMVAGVVHHVESVMLAPNSTVDQVIAVQRLGLAIG